MVSSSIKRRKLNTPNRKLTISTNPQTPNSMTETLEVVDQPLTPAGRLFVQPLMEQVINCAVACEQPLDIPAIKAELKNSIMFKHPRFCSLMIRDSSGREHWRKTEVDIDRHVIIHHQPVDTSISDEDAVNSYIADLTVSSHLPTDKPLWEIHLLMAHKVGVCRMHHALGDGISLMSVLLSCCKRVDDPSAPPTFGAPAAETKKRVGLSLWKVLKVIWYTLIYVLEFGLRGLWKKDKTTALSGGDGVEMWPRKLATARFRLDDMKLVKAAVADATINDVLFGILSSGFSKYLEIRPPQALQEGLQLTGLAMVNLRPQGGLQDIRKLMGNKSGTRWGNKFGMLLLPIYYHKCDSDPIQFLKRAKTMIDKKKLSLEAPFSYRIGYVFMSLFGAKFASILNYRLVCNTTFTISNVLGPREEITFAGNPVKYLRVTSSSLPHAITMHMLSYAGVADMQIMVAKEIIPDPKILARCFEDALLEMKEAATKS